ncbi:MAG: integrase arm-type DNA-binding domain-containing protein [Tsuneonella suprasediminis]|uniref:integrase arm-type DNA-binding domain-containing protein n=1 Tax=Altericroceibacterium spongiae TaxID=2320269 RepID=UPI001EE5F0E0|nr:integrase arm-type DNA-binding domain-containing protein [Altericroceibacterium spongiae]|tara:strand:+ start:441 stop:1109 length:669 start_codon:yes stop_codon:yes gene_type:complete
MQANGHLLPANGATNHLPAQSGAGRGSDEKAKPSNRVRLNGNIVRRKPGKRIREYWDIDLPGFGLRVNPGGRRTWFVLFRQRGKLRRVWLGTSRDISPATARCLARAKLAEVALDGLPTRKKARAAQKSDAPLLRDYAERFWADYSRHWKPSTRKRNESAIFKEILGAFGDRRIDELAKGDILFWRDSFVERPGVFNHTLPVFADAAERVSGSIARLIGVGQ